MSRKECGGEGNKVLLSFRVESIFVSVVRNQMEMEIATQCFGINRIFFFLPWKVRQEPNKLINEKLKGKKCTLLDFYATCSLNKREKEKEKEN